VGAAIKRIGQRELKAKIKSTDLEIIKLESYIKELHEFNFQVLYLELGLPSNWRHMEEEELRGAQRKAGIVSSLKPNVSSKEQREEKRKEIANKKREKEADIAAMRAAGESEESIRRRENTHDDAIERGEQELRKLL
jgi:Tfp pilus assembly protein PilO